MATGPWLAWLPLDYLDRLAAPRLRPLPLAFGRRRCRTGFVARRAAEDLEPFRLLEQTLRDSRSSGMRRRPGSSRAVLLLHREPGIGAAAFLCPSGHPMGLRQASNPRVSSTLIARFGRAGSHENQDRWNHKRTLVTLTLDDGRSSQAGCWGSPTA